MDKTTRFNLGYAIVALVGIFILQNLWAQANAVVTLPYSEFRQLVAKRQVDKVSIGTEDIRGVLNTPVQGKTQFVTTRVEKDLAEELDKHGVSYSGRVENDLISTVLSWILPTLLFFGVWMLLMRRLASQGGGPGGLMSIGKSKAKVYVEADTKTTFEDVAGVDEAKDELKEIVAFLKNPEHYGRLGARMPKGVLLVGAPGTGKTLLARSVAGEAGVPFFSISGSEFVEMFVGVGAARVRDLFESARKKAPAVIFIDELDAMGKARNANPGLGGHDEKEQTLNQLLVELDGFDTKAGIVLLGATNRPEILDPALLRAGRFDRQVLVDRPDRQGRTAILKVHTKKIHLDTAVDLDGVAAVTPGFTGADLANLVNEAALGATRSGADTVTQEDFTKAIERIVAGLEKKNRLMNPREREIVAYHEMGHALTAAGSPGADPVLKVSIIPRGIGALGYTMQRPTEDRYLMTREELETKMVVLMGGRAAEHIVFGHLSTGAADDLSKITRIARSMATRYAMVGELGHVSYDYEGPGFLGQAQDYAPRQYSNETARDIDTAVKKVVDAAFARAVALLTEHRDVLERGARLLLEKETLDDKEVHALCESCRKGDTAAGAVTSPSPSDAGVPVPENA